MTQQTQTGTITQHVNGGMRLQGHSDLPEKLDAGFIDQFKKITNAQAGHLRHFHNLISQPDGDWNLMGGQDPGQEWADAYRYQLATMFYAASTAHYHHLPALRSVFKNMLQQTIHKMLRREVWGYWFNSSHSGPALDPTLTELRKPWADPVIKENIMYSGHLLLMVSLYGMLFNEDKYEQEGSIVLDWNTIFWGMGPQKFSYSRSSLQSAIYNQMERENWMGVCCEPNSIFVVCNQFPIIAMRYNDVRDKTTVVPELLPKYKAAWESKKGFIQDDGHVYSWYRPKQNDKIPGMDIGLTAWASCFMHTWNSEQVESWFELQSLGVFKRTTDNLLTINPPGVIAAIRKLVATEGAEADSAETLQKAWEMADSMGLPPTPHANPTFGYISQWVSEIGDETLTNGLLNYADKCLGPTWEKGGLYYPRNFDISDDARNWKQVVPYDGNAAIAFMRLNPRGGQKAMYDKPWTPEEVSAYPFVDQVSLGDGVDFHRAVWDEELGAMALTARTWDGEERRINLPFRNLPPAVYGIYLNGKLTGTQKIFQKEDVIEVPLTVKHELVNVVLLKS